MSGTYWTQRMSTFVTKTENAKTHSSVELVDLRVSCYKHTHTNIPNSYLYTVSDSPPWAEHQTSQPVAFSHPVCTTPLLLLLHNSILLHKDEGSPVVLPCLHKIPLASLQMLHQNQRRCSFIPHVQVLPLIRVRSSHQHSHDSCDIHNHKEGSAVFAHKRVLHFLTPLGPPMGIELGSCHLLRSIILRRFPNVSKIFKTWAKASHTLRAYLHCKTDDTNSEEVLHRRV